MSRPKKKKVAFASEDKVNGFQDQKDHHRQDEKMLHDDLGDLTDPAKLSKPIKTVQVLRYSMMIHKVCHNCIGQ